MAADETPNPPPERRHSWGSFLLWPVLFVVLYVLSCGPMAKFYEQRSAPRAVVAFYAPLAAAYDSIPAFHSFLTWYVGLWGVKSL